MQITLTGPFPGKATSDMPFLDHAFGGRLDMIAHSDTAITLRNARTGAETTILGTGLNGPKGTVTGWITRDGTGLALVVVDTIAWSLAALTAALEALEAGDDAPLLTLLSRQAITLDAAGMTDPARVLLPAGINATVLIIGSARDDMLRGGHGTNEIWAGAGDDTLIGTLGTSALVGGAGDDLIDSRIEGPATVYGGEGNDTLIGGPRSRLWGGPGDDLLDGRPWARDLNGGAGNDTLYLSELKSLAYGDAGDDHIFGGAGHDTLSGGLGDDTIRGSGGDDVLALDYGRDLAFGGEGNDTITANAGHDTLYGGAGNDTIHIARDTRYDSSTIYGGDGHDRLGSDGYGHHTIYGGPGYDRLTGGAGNDGLAGGDGNDLLAGGGGDDTLRGNAGNDTVRGGAGADQFEFWRGFGWTRVEDFDRAEGDTIGLAKGMWTATHGALTARQVLDTFGSVNAGGDAVLTFAAAGTTVVIVGAGTLAGLADDLVIL